MNWFIETNQKPLTSLFFFPLKFFLQWLQLWLFMIIVLAFWLLHFQSFIRILLLLFNLHLIVIAITIAIVISTVILIFRLFLFLFFIFVILQRIRHIGGNILAVLKIIVEINWRMRWGILAITLNMKVLFIGIVSVIGLVILRFLFILLHFFRRVFSIPFRIIARRLLFRHQIRNWVTRLVFKWNYLWSFQ